MTTEDKTAKAGSAEPQNFTAPAEVIPEVAPSKLGARLMALLKGKNVGTASIFATNEDGGALPRNVDVPVDEDKVAEFDFHAPGLKLKGKKQVTMKSLHPQGALVQLPNEPQINNGISGDPQDKLGLNLYRRKGFQMLEDENGNPIVCQAWGCWAEAQPQFAYYCCEPHRDYTNPAGEAAGVGFSFGATTKRNVRLIG